MLSIPFYNINLKREYQYSYLLHILVRTMWLAINCKITKKGFLSACKENGISKTSAYRCWRKWAYKNKFIKYVGDDKEYLYITSKHTFELIIEKVPASIYKEIKTLTNLKDFLHSSRLWRSWVKNKKTNTWKGIRSIANETWSTPSTICNRNKRAKKFWLSYKKRYWVYNWLLIRLTNVYTSSIRVIRNKYCAVNNLIKKSKKAIINDHLAPLFKTLNTKIAKKLSWANDNDYELINKILYPKLI